VIVSVRIVLVIPEINRIALSRDEADFILKSSLRAQSRNYLFCKKTGKLWRTTHPEFDSQALQPEKIFARTLSLCHPALRT